MKRSPLKRKTPLKARSELRRGKRLNRRSKTNSHPHENTALRRRYQEENPTCELTSLLMESGNASWETYRKSWGDVGFAILDPHHIVSEGMRPDYWWNLITVCRPVHDWIHANPVEGRIVCVWVKVRKREVEPQEFKRVFGFELLGWLENHSVAEPLIERLRLEAVVFLRSQT